MVVGRVRPQANAVMRAPSRFTATRNCAKAPLAQRLRFFCMNPAYVIMTCVSLLAIDGDTVKCDGQNLRPMGDGEPFVSGFDTPELSRWAKCDQENHMGLLAAARMSQLLQTDGLVVENSGQTDAFDRPLVVLRLPDGSTIGQTLIDEGLARVWTPEYQPDWCN